MSNNLMASQMVNPTNWNEYKMQFHNLINVMGVPSGEPVKSFKSKQGEQFYDVTLDVMRTSHTIDKVPVTFSVSDLHIVKEALENEAQLCVTGELRTKFVADNKNKDGLEHMRLLISVFSRNMFWNDGPNEDLNDGHFIGELGKIKPVRETPSGMTIIDFTLRLKARPNSNKTYRVPCIAWGHLAKWVNTLESGTNVQVDGRLQSREYTTSLGETKLVNELSVYELSVL